MHVSFWSTNTSAEINYRLNGGSTNTAVPNVSSNAIAGWYRIEADIHVPANNTMEIWTEGLNATTVYHDDFRIHRHESAMTSYVYNEWDELSDILDANNMATHYEYDEMGRLASVHQESFKYGKRKVSENEINYARMNIE